MHLSMTLLGAFEVCVEGTPIAATTWKLRHPRELLQMVALHAGQRVPREQVLEALWPQADPQAASNRLYHTIHLLRSAFVKAGVPKDEPVLLLDSGVLQLNPRHDWVIDVCEFRAQIEQSRRSAEPATLGRAIELYRGELLSGFACSDWMAPHRDAHRLDHVWALNRLATLRREAGDLERAIGLYQKLLDVEPADELAHRALMELFDLTQHPERAVYQYSDCKRALRRDLDVDPSPATQAVLDRIVTAARQRKTESDAVRPPARARYVAPAHAIPMLGRAEDLASLRTWITRESVRLVTITGAAGLGKTRLAHALLEQCQDDFDAGVAALPLTSLAAAPQLAQELSGALGVAHSEQPPLERLIAHLRKRRMLLLLDRFEHIVEAGPVLSQLLAAAPGLTIVVTSQVPLHLPMERVYRLPSLVDRRGEDAVQLFCKVASNLNCRIEHADDLALVASICLRLGGNALAIHLAARQTQVLSLPQMMRELDQPLQLLVTTLRDVEVQHRSLRDAITWAHSLLGSGARRLFALLGVFRSTFGTDDAVEVLAAFYSRNASRPGLADLVERHLVSLSGEAAQAWGPPRLMLLDSLAQFARDKLDASGETAALQEAHARHFARRAALQFERVRLGDNREPIAFFRADRASTVAAVAGAITDAAELLQAALDRQCEATAEERRLSAWCAYRLARTYAWRATPQTEHAIRRARELCDGSDDPLLRNKVYTYLASDRMNQGKHRVAIALLTRLIERHEASGDSRILVGNYGLRATALHAHGDARAALASAAAAVRHARTSARPELLAYALMIECEETMRAGDIAAARRAVEEIGTLPKTCISSLRELHLQLLDCFVDLEGAEFEVAEFKLRGMLDGVRTPERVRTRVFVELSCDLIAVEQGRFDAATTLATVSLASLPRNPAFDDMTVRLLCARLRLFAARGEWHKASQSARQLFDRTKNSTNRVWCAWAFEACALALLERRAWPECRHLLALSKKHLHSIRVEPTPRQRRNWSHVEARIGAHDAKAKATAAPQLQNDASAEQAAQRLRERVLALVSGEPALAASVV
jgi:DNA-binding SARP family transcriptional activator/predicted ATPase